MDRALLQQAQRMRLHTRRRAAGEWLGAFRSHWKGQGLEYAESRIYEPGDDIRHLDWKVTARKGKLHTKTYEEERRLSSLVCVDISSSMYFGSKERTKAEMAATLAAIVAFASLGAGDSCQLWLFDSAVRQTFGPFRSKASIWHFIHAWEARTFDDANHGEQTSLAALSKAILALRRRPQVAFIFSDMDAADADSVSVKQLTSTIDVLPLQITHAWEREPTRVKPRWFDFESMHAAKTRQLAIRQTLGGRPVQQANDNDNPLKILQQLAMA